MTIRAPFMPKQGANQMVTLAAATPQTTAIGAGQKSLRVVNAGADTAHIALGTAAEAPTATTANLPVRANSEIVIQKDEAHDTVSSVSTLGTTLHIQPGEGGH